MRLTDLGQARQADLEIRFQHGELAILFSSFEGWSARSFTYEQIMQTYSGFVIQVHDAQDWPDFDTFRESIRNAHCHDEEYAMMRRTNYRHQDIELSASYGPFQSMFRYACTNERSTF